MITRKLYVCYFLTITLCAVNKLFIFDFFLYKTSISEKYPYLFYFIFRYSFDAIRQKGICN